MDLKPDPVAEAVAEAVPVAGLLDDRPRRRVDFPPRRPGGNRGQTCLLCAQRGSDSPVANVRVQSEQ